MKILLISTCSGSRGGGELYLCKLAGGLAELGHEVHVLVNTSSVMDELAGKFQDVAVVHRIAYTNVYVRKTRLFGALADIHQQLRLTRFCLALQPEIIHVNQQVMEDGLEVLLAVSRTSIPFVCTSHVTRSATQLGARLGWLRDLIVGQIVKKVRSHHIVVAKNAGEELRRYLPFLSKERCLHVVHNGICRQNQLSTARTREDVRRQWRLAESELVVATVGRIEQQKNPEFFLEIIEALRESGHTFKAVWIGDGRLRKEFERSIVRRGLKKWVRVDGWRDDVFERLSGVDVFIQPSRFEGLPLALLEALCSGIPCCVSDVDGMPEAVENGVNGYVCKVEQVEDWQKKIGRLLTDASLRKRFGKSASEIADQKFSLRAMTSATENVYHEILAGWGDRKSKW